MNFALATSRCMWIVRLWYDTSTQKQKLIDFNRYYSKNPITFTFHSTTIKVNAHILPFVVLQLRQLEAAGKYLPHVIITIMAVMCWIACISRVWSMGMQRHRLQFMAEPIALIPCGTTEDKIRWERTIFNIQYMNILFSNEFHELWLLSNLKYCTECGVRMQCSCSVSTWIVFFFFTKTRSPWTCCFHSWCLHSSGTKASWKCEAVCWQHRSRDALPLHANLFCWRSTRPIRSKKPFTSHNNSRHSPIECCRV